MEPYTAAEMAYRTADCTIPPMAATNIVIEITNGCEYCSFDHEQKPLYHSNKYEPYTCMQSYITIEKWKGKKGFQCFVCVDLWDDGNACADFEIHYCPMCGRKFQTK